MGYGKRQGSGAASDDAADATHDTSHRAGAGGRARRSGGAAGKRTLTEGLPASKRSGPPSEITMTGDEYIDGVNPCGPNGSKVGTDECSLDFEQDANLDRLLIAALAFLGLRIQAAFGRVRIGKVLAMMARQRLIDGFTDALLLGGLAFFKPVASAFAKQVEGVAWNVAKHAPRAANAMAVAASAVDPVVQIGGQVLRAKLRDIRVSNGTHPENDQAYLDALEGGVPAMLRAMLNSTAGQSHKWKLAFLAAIEDDTTTSTQAFVDVVEWLLKEFKECRIGQVEKDDRFGEEMGMYQEVQFSRGKTMVVLLEGYVARRPVHALIGAPEGTTNQTPMFVRFVPVALHDMAREEMKKKRGEGAMESIKFYGSGSARNATPWFQEAGQAFLKLKKGHVLPDYVKTDVQQATPIVPGLADAGEYEDPDLDSDEEVVA